jgi:hypothetical protein
MKRFLKFAAIFLLVAAAVVAVLIFWPLRDKHSVVRLAQGVLAVRGATIHMSPDMPPLHNTTLVARDGRIVALGNHVNVPADHQTFSPVEAKAFNGAQGFADGSAVNHLVLRSATLDRGSFRHAHLSSFL